MNINKQPPTYNDYIIVYVGGFFLNNTKNNRYFTSNVGTPIANDDHTKTIGDRGPGVLVDTELIEKLAHFDRERIPERVVHAKGAGAHGYFVCYNSMKDYTKADFLSDRGKRTPVFVRFSTVIGSKGSPDTVRDPRGFAVKFYTEEGNYDLVGNDIPVFFIRDAIKFPDLIHSLKPSPDTNLADSERFWDFYSKTPEATHMITWLYSDRGTIKSFRKIEGFGVNTYIFCNELGDKKFVKFHWKPLAGLETIAREEAAYLAGKDPDIAVKDLYHTLYQGKTVDFDLYVQLMDMDKEFSFDFDPLDDTKTWPEDLLPLIPVGRMTLNRPPQNFFAEVEQVAFCPGNIVPGIEFSADKMLQGRSFSYLDTQRYRIGTNFTQLPINAPKIPVINHQQDGSMRYFAKGGSLNYSPNTLYNNEPMGNPEFKDISPMFYQGYEVRESIPVKNDFKQAGERYLSLTKIERDHLIDNILSEVKYINKELQKIIVGYFTQANEEFGIRVANGLK